jgi:hypothetical protein
MGRYLASSGVFRDSCNCAKRLIAGWAGTFGGVAADEAAVDEIAFDDAVYSAGGGGLFLTSAVVSKEPSDNCAYRLRRLESIAGDAVTVFSQGISVAEARRGRSLVIWSQGASGEAALLAGWAVLAGWSGVMHFATGGGLNRGAESCSAQPVQKTSAKTSGRKPREMGPQALRSIMCANSYAGTEHPC